MTLSNDACLHACRIKRALANFEQYARQRPSRRPGQRLASVQLERAVVTGAKEALLLRLRHDGAGKVSAFLSECDEVVFARAHQQALVALLGIGEDQRLSDCQIAQPRDAPDRREPAPPAY